MNIKCYAQGVTTKVSTCVYDPSCTRIERYLEKQREEDEGLRVKLSKKQTPCSERVKKKGRDDVY